MPTRASAARAWSRASAALTSWCARTASTICVSMRSTGFSVIIGSWNTMAMRAPRTLRSSSSASPTRSVPSKRIRPPTMRPGGSTSPRIENPVTVFPQPDSPTRPSTSPARTSKLTPSTARTTPARVKKWVRRFCTSKVLPFKARIEDIAQAVADEVDAHDRGEERDARVEADPVLARQHVLEAIGDQQAERGLGERQADAEERERRLERDGVRGLQGADHDHRGDHIGQEMAKDDARGRQGKAMRGLDVLLAPLDERRAAHGARVVGPLHQDQRDHHLVRAAAEDRHQDQRDEDGGEGELGIDQAHDERLEPAAAVR